MQLLSTIALTNIVRSGKNFSLKIRFNKMHDNNTLEGIMDFE